MEAEPGIEPRWTALQSVDVYLFTFLIRRLRHVDRVVPASVREPLTLSWLRY